MKEAMFGDILRDTVFSTFDGGVYQKISSASAVELNEQGHPHGHELPFQPNEVVLPRLGAFDSSIILDNLSNIL